MVLNGKRIYFIFFRLHAFHSSVELLNLGNCKIKIIFVCLK